MLSAYTRLLVAQIRSQTQYRLSFLADVVSTCLMSLLDIVAVLVLFRVTPALGGFSGRQVLVMAAMALLAFSLSDLLVGNVERLRFYIRTGLFDVVLLRPLSALGQLLVIDFAPRRTGRVVQALVILAVALFLVDIDWSVARVAILVVTPLAGSLIFASIFVAGATVAFWWVESGELANAFTYGGRDFTTYPVSVYSGWFRRLFAYGLGFAFVAYYPALFLLDVPDPLGAPIWLGWGTPVVALLAMTVAACVWRTGVRHYRSTGS